MSDLQRNEQQRRLSLPVQEGSRQAARLGESATAAPATMVNRTHRIVRERARRMQDRKTMQRSLWLPLIVCSGLLLLLCSAVWSVLDQYELEPTGVPDPSQQMIVLLMWCLPLSVILFAVVWFRRSGGRSEGETRS